MKKSFALNELEKRMPLSFRSKSEAKDDIRIIADKDESFENIVFELGCSVLAKKAMKKGRRIP